MLDELKLYLEDTMVPLFSSLIEDGRIKFDIKNDQLVKSSENSSVQISRYLWFFSKYYGESEEDSILNICSQLYESLKENYKVNDGYKISTINDEYHVYHNSFVLYGMSEYYKITQDKSVLLEIDGLHNFIEKNFYNKDKGMYHEQIDNSLNRVSRSVIDSRENGYSANSIIHLLEAYTNVVEVAPKYKSTLERILNILFRKFYNQKGFFASYVDSHLRQDISYISYGHDIETICLVGEALKALDIRISEYELHLNSIYNTVVNEGLEFDGFLRVQSDLSISTWWGQVEAIVGFMFCNKELNNTNDYYKLVYEFTRDNYMTNKGLYNEIDNHRLVLNNETANIWKTPYHDGRMIMKMITYLESEE
ncbi:AGE family epimerase/isomerase [Mollicutes bacterium LVI A0078]|nr:AGE family epimerase/isomerase [Mollicutes bacterium LVI A0075]WOO90381.1 AGE family epimerase/isomerase [Mollicutes bacterium LVI A0078]